MTLKCLSREVRVSEAKHLWEPSSTFDLGRDPSLRSGWKTDRRFKKHRL